MAFAFKALRYWVLCVFFQLQFRFLSNKPESGWGRNDGDLRWQETSRRVRVNGQSMWLLFILFVLRSASSLSWNHSNQMFTHKIPLKLLSRLLVNCMLHLMDHSLSLASSLCTSICQLITPPFLSSRTLYPSVFWLLQWLLLLGLHSSSCLWPKYWRTQISFWISPLYILTLGCPIHIYVDSFQIYLSIADLFLNSKWIYATA